MRKRTGKLIVENVLLAIILTHMCVSPAYAADGFMDFELGANANKILQVGQKKCVFGSVENDTRWLWKQHLVCDQFLYKGVRTKLIFEFVDDHLVRIIVLSKDIANYLLLRNNIDVELLAKSIDSKGSMNSSDIIFQEKVHQFENGQQLTYFYHNGSWEWEIKIEHTKYKEEEQVMKKEQLAEEERKGSKGWHNFVFGDMISETREKAEGLCEALNNDETTYLKDKKVMVCYNFPFLQKKIDVRFGFYKAKLVDIELMLQSELYQKLLPLLKQKYGKPYREFADSRSYYPYIIFPKQNISLSYKRNDQKPSEIWVSLKYKKEGYIDPAEEIIIEEKKKQKQLPDRMSEDEFIMKNI